MITGFMRPSRIPFSISRRMVPRRSPPGVVCWLVSVGSGDDWFGTCRAGPADVPGDPCIARPNICPRMSPRLPPEEAGGWDGDADVPVDPLRVSPETRTPASTGNSFLRIFESTPENFCA